ncbi:hypothetical protein I315_03115 [Cryptococcus gattii Ru294]|nr:hypothetical protein I315_03115 [Cryptococcus gattii Ru294]
MHISIYHHCKPATGLMPPCYIKVRVHMNNPKFIISQGLLLHIILIFLPKDCQEAPPHQKMVVFTACGPMVSMSVMPEWEHTTISLNICIFTYPRASREKQKATIVHANVSGLHARLGILTLLVHLSTMSDRFILKLLKKLQSSSYVCYHFLSHHLVHLSVNHQTFLNIF